jgi:hypothetical protein
MRPENRERLLMIVCVATVGLLALLIALIGAMNDAGSTGGY